MREMVESLVLELLQIKAVTKCIHVHIGYAAEDVYKRQVPYVTSSW